MNSELALAAGFGALARYAVPIDSAASRRRGGRLVAAEAPRG